MLRVVIVQATLTKLATIFIGGAVSMLYKATPEAHLATNCSLRVTSGRRHSQIPSFIYHEQGQKGNM